MRLFFRKNKGSTLRKFELTPSNEQDHQISVISDPESVAQRLKQLSPDLSLALFHEVILGGLGGRNEADTPASAKIAPGVQQWLKTVDSLRTLLALAGWHIYDQQNSPFISSPDRTISIVTMTGNKETGQTDDSSSQRLTNRSPKGAVTESFVQSNSQLELFNLDSLRSLNKADKAGTQVWVLLYHYDQGLQEVRFELALPIGFCKTKITTWGERLILGRIPNNHTNFTIHDYDDGSGPSTPATVQVELKPDFE